RSATARRRRARASRGQTSGQSFQEPTSVGGVVDGRYLFRLSRRQRGLDFVRLALVHQFHGLFGGLGQQGLQVPIVDRFRLAGRLLARLVTGELVRLLVRGRGGGRLGLGGLRGLLGRGWLLRGRGDLLGARGGVLSQQEREDLDLRLTQWLVGFDGDTHCS